MTDSMTVLPCDRQYDQRLDRMTVDCQGQITVYFEKYKSSVRGGMVSLVGMVILHWYALKTKQSPTMFLKHTVSKSTVKQMLAKLRVYCFKAPPAL
ncbi:unnamed protein product [Boreogadus saida]